MKKFNNLIFNGIIIESGSRLKSIINLIGEFHNLTGGLLPANYLRFKKS